jgi:hypothetical protein
MQRKAAPAATGSINAALRAWEKDRARTMTTTATTTTTTVRRRQDPWDANYVLSLEMQHIIKLVASALLSSSQLPCDGNPSGADAVLRALLDANPWSCNATNVVCALPLSSRLLGRQQRCWGGYNNNDEAEVEAEGEGKGEEEREGG